MTCAMQSGAFAIAGVQGEMTAAIQERFDARRKREAAARAEIESHNSVAVDAAIARHH